MRAAFWGRTLSEEETDGDGFSPPLKDFAVAVPSRSLGTSWVGPL